MSFDDWYAALRGAGSAYQRIQEAALGPGQVVGQQGLCTAEAIMSLVGELQLRPGDRLLDVCCGAGGPAGLVAARLGCAVVGLDRSPAALSHAARCGAAGARF